MDNKRKTDLTVKLTGKDGNVFNLIGVVRRALNKAGHQDLAKEMVEKCFQASSYADAISIMDKYVKVE